MRKIEKSILCNVIPISKVRPWGHFQGSTLGAWGKRAFNRGALVGFYMVLFICFILIKFGGAGTIG